MPLPYVNELKYLGNILQANNKMSADCSSKRAKFISKVHSLNQEFNYADPYTILKLYDIYIRDFCGSNIWDLYSMLIFKDFKIHGMLPKERILFNLNRTHIDM